MRDFSMSRIAGSVYNRDASVSAHSICLCMSRWRGFVVIVVRFHELHGARSNRSKDAIHGTASKQIPRSARADHLTESIDNGGQAKLALRICEFPGATSVRSRFSTR